jgi:hypothetical protein
VTFLGIPQRESTVGIANDRGWGACRTPQITFSPERLIQRLPAAQVAEAREVDGATRAETPSRGS